MLNVIFYVVLNSARLVEALVRVYPSMALEWSLVFGKMIAQHQRHVIAVVAARNHAVVADHTLFSCSS